MIFESERWQMLGKQMNNLAIVLLIFLLSIQVSANQTNRTKKQIKIQLQFVYVLLKKKHLLNPNTKNFATPNIHKQVQTKYLVTFIY